MENKINLATLKMQKTLSINLLATISCGYVKGKIEKVYLEKAVEFYEFTRDCKGDIASIQKGTEFIGDLTLFAMSDEMKKSLF